MEGSRCNRGHVQGLSGICDGQVGCTKLQLSARGCVFDAHGRPVSPNPAKYAATLDCPRASTVINSAAGHTLVPLAGRRL